MGDSNHFLSVVCEVTNDVFSEGDKAGSTLALLSGGSFSMAALKKIVTAPVASAAPSMLSPSGWLSVFGVSLLFIFGYSVVASGREKLTRSDK